MQYECNGSLKIPNFAPRLYLLNWSHVIAHEYTFSYFHNPATRIDFIMSPWIL